MGRQSYNNSRNGRKPEKSNPLVLVEHGACKYSNPKMQSAHLIQREITLDNAKEVILENRKEARKCFVIGTNAFQKEILKMIRAENRGWDCKTAYHTIDEMMEKEGYSFPEAVQERTKESPAGKPRTNLGQLYRQLVKEGLDEDSAAGILLAADELSGYKIFPNTPENIYKAFLRLACDYLQDKELAKQAVDIYLQVLAENQGES